MSGINNVTPIRRAADAVHGAVTPEPGLTDLVSQLTGDAKDVARAEIALQKAKVGEAVGRYKNAAIFFVAAGVLALAGLIALLVGLIETLATLIGPGWATFVVAGAVFLIAGVLAMVGKNRLSPGADA
ncbi:phage holin family protein [Sphingomonas sp.]|uniref:phage holin family protein n=1 Tax=Sphingomonas sp. TaxID=28214 RepID=UPI0035C85BB7